MTSGLPSLDDLRREIDEIDDALHDLLMRRAELGERIGKAKGKQTVYIRPGREAQILRRLVARHRGPFPARVLARLWREIVSAFSAMQGAFAVAASAPESGPDLTHLARDHFGSENPIRGYESSFGVLRAVSDGEANVGVLPLPRDDDQEAWWRFLARGGEARPRIVARLPFAPSSQRRPAEAEALAVGLMAQEESGLDRSYLILETQQPLSRSSLKQLLDSADLSTLDIKVWPEPPDRYLHLIEVEGFLAEDDPRLGRLMESGGDSQRHAWAVGGYAIPLTAAELDGATGGTASRSAG